MYLKNKQRALVLVTAAMAAGALITGCGGGNDAPDTEDAALQLKPSDYSNLTVTVDGVATKIRQYKVVYVAKPVKMALVQTNEAAPPLSQTVTDPYTYQTMLISVPEALANDQKAALWVRTNNSGWFASVATDPVSGSVAMLKIKDGTTLSTGAVDTNVAAAAAALKAGYIVVDVGTRSRGIKAEDGTWAGKAPAVVVDVKAAIRYLRLNDSILPGSSERIILTGHSGGGAVTSAVAASGNSTDYLPYLEAIGAAGVAGSGSSASSTIKDDVFAAVAYSPIQNYGNADAAYEWQYSAIRDDSNTPLLGGIAYSNPASRQPAASAAYAAAFGPYLNSLQLKRDDCSLLTEDNMQATITAELKAEIERQIAAGTAVPQLGDAFTINRMTSLPPLPAIAPITSTPETAINTWLTLNGSGTSATVANIDYTAFLRFTAGPSNPTLNANPALRKLKSVVAFDSVGVTDLPAGTLAGESNLFGSATQRYINYSEWAWNNNRVAGDGSGLDDTGKTWAQFIATDSTVTQQLKLINPVDYLKSALSSPAPYWYVRHGMLDRDTSPAIQILLRQALKNNSVVKETNFKFSYGIGHTGFTDVAESFDWIKAKLAANP